ncbi:MAG TPA: hypothetical protein DCS19_01595 [Flavobacterium sp.]|nr:hypothetical protein [Flavobacterium sp.]
MPFISKVEFEKLAGASGTRKLIAKLTDEDFDGFEAQAASIITSITSLDVPADNADAPNWVKLPAMWLIQYIYAQGADSKENTETYNNIYDKAINILTNHSDGGDSPARSMTGSMEGCYEF